MKIIYYVSLCLLTFSMSGCISPALQKVNEAIDALDRGIAALQTASGNWQSEIHNIADDIPKELHDVIDQVNALGNNLIGAAGAQIMCNSSWAKEKAIQTLKNIKHKLLHEAYDLPMPGFCSVNIPAVNLNDAPAGWASVNVFGFDLNTPDSNHRLIQVVLIGDTSNLVISENLIGRTTNYQISINLNALITELVSNKYQKIQLFWNGSSKNLPQILLIKWVPRIKQAYVPAFDMTWNPPAIGGPDRNFDLSNNNWTDVHVHVEFRHTTKTIDARVYMDAMEFGGDNTRVGGPLNFETAYKSWTTIYTLNNPEYEIQTFSPNDQASYATSFRNQGSFDFSPGGSVSTYSIQIEQAGADNSNAAGSADCRVVAHFKQITVVLLQKSPTN